jgi:cytochrome c2
MRNLSFLLLSLSFTSCSTQVKPSEAPPKGTEHTDSTCSDERCLDSVDLSTVEGLARAIVAAVSTGKPERLEALLITETEAAAVIENMPRSPEDKQKILERITRTRAEFPQRWADLEKFSADLGVPLTALRFLSVGPYETQVKNNVEVVKKDLLVRVSAPGQEDLALGIESCIKVGRGWVLGHPEVELGRIPASRESTPLPREQAPVEPTVATSGLALLERLRCVTCHQVSEGEPRPLGPSLYGIFGASRETAKGKVIVDRAYLRASIEEPQAHIVDGYRVAMPSYRGNMTEGELTTLLDYLELLGK